MPEIQVPAVPPSAQAALTRFADTLAALHRKVPAFRGMHRMIAAALTPVGPQTFERELGRTVTRQLQSRPFRIDRLLLTQDGI